MKKVCVITTTRADFGLLSPVIKELITDKFFDVQILVSGTHLLEEYGYTKNEILDLGFKKYIKEIPVIEKSKNSSCEILANYIKKFEKELNEINPDAVLVLGDRFEIVGVASVCLLLNIPLIHISGGDVTFGAIDDACRHSITKMSDLHFTGNEYMRQRVIQMGENPQKVFNVGETGVENIIKTELMSFEEFKTSVGMKDLKQGKFCIVTYHPETLEKHSPKEQISWLLNQILNHPEFDYIITKSNIDDGGEEINKYINEKVKGYTNIKFIDSLGFKRYLSALKYGAMVIGNSSSGIIEAPYLNIPTINIGNRQEGRMQAKSIINVDLYDDLEFERAIKKACDKKFLKLCKYNENLYGDGNTSKEIVSKMKEFLKLGLDKKKRFFDILKEK